MKNISSVTWFPCFKVSWTCTGVVCLLFGGLDGDVGEGGGSSQCNTN